VVCRRPTTRKHCASVLLHHRGHRKALPLAGLILNAPTDAGSLPVAAMRTVRNVGSQVGLGGVAGRGHRVRIHADVRRPRSGEVTAAVTTHAANRTCRGRGFRRCRFESSTGCDACARGDHPRSVTMPGRESTREEQASLRTRRVWCSHRGSDTSPFCWPKPIESKLRHRARLEQKSHEDSKCGGLWPLGPLVENSHS